MHYHHTLVRALVDERQRRLAAEAPLRRLPRPAPVRRRGSNMPGPSDTS
jgi:hypothetical protein